MTAFEQEGVRAINPPMGFPMESDRWPEKMWVVFHKLVAVAAGLGMMAIHCNVIHPKFGNFILLGTILIGAEATEYDRPIDYNPCLSCKLCVAAYPVQGDHDYGFLLGGPGDEDVGFRDNRPRVAGGQIYPPQPFQYFLRK